MHWLSDAWEEIFGVKPKKKLELRFSEKGFKAYAVFMFDRIVFLLGNEWQKVDEDIVKGLVQHLLLNFGRKTAKRKVTKWIELYNSFIKHLSDAQSLKERKPTSKELEESFNRVNKEYFFGVLDMPKLRWVKSIAQIGCYDFVKDEIRISNLLKDAPNELLDYVMYHELLHKWLKFKLRRDGTALYHSRKFTKAEKKFRNAKEVEKKLKLFIRKKLKAGSSFF
ncbi:hypothetical protein DRJ19_00415 [Candidatus Woesearchaeota archaeon]|nr:MAG: hypothetical protein DRJ19_00415 [Candidatus Woesearchaeota archaeon]